MDRRTMLLDSIRQGLSDGVISHEDVAALLPLAFTRPISPQPLPSSVANQSTQISSVTPQAATNTVPIQPVADKAKVSFVDVLFYLAGGVLYAALMVIATQSTGDSPAIGSSTMLISGLVLWLITFWLAKRPRQSDNQTGFSNALLLTGCLSLISGGMMVASQLTENNSDTAGYAVGIAFLLLGGLHIYFDVLLKRTVLIVLGVFLFVLAFPAFMASVLAGKNVAMDVWVLVSIFTGLLLAISGHIASRTASGRSGVFRAFLSIASFIILGSVYIATLSSNAALLWSICMPLLIYTAFYVSIKRRNKHFLANGSIFLVLFIISMAFKYFSGLGAAVSLFISATALLGTAFMAAAINKRYIKPQSSFQQDVAQ